MKFVLSLLVVLASTVGMACPDLTGEFENTESGVSATYTISQQTVDGVTTYSLTYFENGFTEKDEVIADGVARPIDIDSDYFETSTQTATCDTTALKSHIEGVSHEGGTAEMNLVFSLTGKDLKIDSNEAWADGTDVGSSDETLIFTRK